ncbi:hypothetical protein [uncultured Roseovarius sp.]|uniref:hypothetical protein n=1 Tax=uncultured Roseovarius sp. TaxID=293344 RepID=UPI002601F26B|nr:hypothetical protein [uncultured Roseovarius sp.]
MRLILSVFLMLFPQLSPAQTSAQYFCNGQFAGTPLQGQVLVQYLTYSQTYGYYGTLYDAGGTRYDFEVISNQNGGVGGAWVNGARHRGSKIEMRYQGNNMSIVNLDTGQQGTFVCN